MIDFSDPRIVNSVSYDLDELIRRASSNNYPKPAIQEYQTATAFSSWVYMLSHPESIGSKTTQDTFSQAKHHEMEVQKMYKGMEKCLDFCKAEWRVIFLDPLTQNSGWFPTKNLEVGGKKLRCRPDVVLYNESSNDLMIIERKIAVTSPAYIPDRCYPNVLAQLWCYSDIDFEKALWPKSKRQLLVCALWARTKNQSVSDHGEERYFQFDKNDNDFKKIEKLFELFRGTQDLLNRNL